MSRNSVGDINACAWCKTNHKALGYGLHSRTRLSPNRCKTCDEFFKWAGKFVGKIAGLQMQLDRNKIDRRRAYATVVNYAWNELAKDIMLWEEETTPRPTKEIFGLDSGERIYEGSGLLGIDTTRIRFTENRTISSLVEALGGEMENHIDFLNDLRSATEMNRADLYLHKTTCQFYQLIQSSMILEEQKQRRELKKVEQVLLIERYMKLGPDMPRILAEAMAKETLPMEQASQIFREKWHLEPLTNEIMTHLLAGKLDYENASWMQQNAKHEKMVKAILNQDADKPSIDLDVAKHLINIGLGEYPAATEAIIEGNTIELVASMYGISLPETKEQVEKEPVMEIETETSSAVDNNPEWSDRFDDIE